MNGPLESRRAQPVSTPRVLMASPRSFERALFRCGQVECEDVICGVDSVELLAPQAASRGEGAVARRLRRAAQRLAGVELKFAPTIQKVRVERDYDLFFFYAQSIDDLSLLDSVVGWRERSAKAVCLIEEVWSDELANGKLPEALGRFDLLAVNFHGSVEPLQKSTGRPCIWLPPGVDTLRFCPGVAPPARSIDVFGMGRRSEETHRALVEHAQTRGWTYLFDTIDPQRVRNSVHEHRTQLAELIKRSRYFIVNRAKIDLVEQTRGQDEVGFRSFEGAAGGAVMIGHTPRGPSASALFDWPDAHIHVAADSAALIDVMLELDGDPERVQRIRRDNIRNTLLRHDWSYRWRTLLDAIGMSHAPQLDARTAQLEALARSVSERKRSAA